MKKLSKFTAFALVAATALSVALSGCKSKDNSVDLSGAPDYSSYDGEFLTYGYTGPTDGTWFRDDEQYNTGEDYRTEERYREYKEAGFNTLLIQGTNRIRAKTLKPACLNARWTGRMPPG